MKQYFYLLSITSLFFMSLRTYADELTGEQLKNSIIPSQSANTILSSETWTQSWEWFLDAILDFMRDGIFALMAVIAIWMFLFIWARLIMARGNPEEFKKAMMSFVYAAIWIFTVAIAWALVRFIAWLNL